MSTTHEQVLEEIVEAIEVPDTAFEAAVAKYESLTDWLERAESSLARAEPYLAPQGSFALGTAIRPLGNGDEYDVDIICRLNWTKSDVSQFDLKQAIGQEIKLYAKQHAMSKTPMDKRRCWTLEYADGTKFHIDILPCVLDAKRYRDILKNRGLADFEDFDRLTEDALAITDKTEPGYYEVSEAWPTSNPLGYAQWFKSQQEAALLEGRAALVRKGLYAKAEDIPEFKIKTPLQKAIMLLKRHRDSMFEDDAEKKPISIIITTLAARAYTNTASLVETLGDILPRLEEGIEQRGDVIWISNPVNPAENFADKWAEDVELKSAFLEWLRTVRRDFGTYIRASRPDKLPAGLGHRLKGPEVSKIIDRLDERPKPQAAPLRLIAAVGRVEGRRSATAPWVPLVDD